MEKFPEIEESEPDFKEVIISSPDSSLWPMGEEDHSVCLKYSNDENCHQQFWLAHHTQNRYQAFVCGSFVAQR